MNLNISPILAILCILLFVLVLVWITKNQFQQEDYLNFWYRSASANDYARIPHKKLVYDPTDFSELSPFRKKDYTLEEIEHDFNSENLFYFQTPYYTRNYADLLTFA